MPLTKIQSLGITDGTIVNADINASAAITSTKLSGVGITNIQSFVLTTSLTTSGSGYIQSNISANDQSSYSGIGSIVSQSSGTFSFSATGYYLITWNFPTYFTVSASQDTGSFEILTTTDNSTYTKAITVLKNYDYIENLEDAIHLECLVNVNNISNVKVRFGYGAVNGWDGIQFYASASDYERCQMNFIRLGDSV